MIPSSTGGKLRATEAKCDLDVDTSDNCLDCASILCSVPLTQFCVTTVFLCDGGGLGMLIVL